MLGVVLWSDAKDGKAVFWCEDQGDLAYYEIDGGLVAGPAAFDPGDMVQFDVSVDERLRRASNPQLVKEKAYPGLPETLRQNSQSPANSERDAKVVRLNVARRSADSSVPLRSKRKA